MFAFRGSSTTLEVYTIFTISTVGAEAGQVELTELSSDVSLVAPWTLLAEAGIVVIAQRQLRVFLDMDVETFVTILAVPILIEELALAHFAEVVLMQIVAFIPLLAKTFQPMLAHVVVVVSAIMV